MKILRKAGTVLLAAVMCLSSFFAENVHAQEQTKGHIKSEVELYSVYTSSETWTCQKSGWYRIWCVGASGDGGDGASGKFTSNKRHCRSGSGGNSGAIAISDLYFKKGLFSWNARQWTNTATCLSRWCVRYQHRNNLP